VALSAEAEAEAEGFGSSPAELYHRKFKPSDGMEILVEGTKGMEIYVFEGPGLMEVMRRYNLFSGGGALPPLWGMGLK